MRRGSHRSRAWLAALPALMLVGGGVLLPFAWRSGDFLAGLAAGVLQRGAWPEDSPFVDPFYLEALWNTAWLSALSAGLGLLLGTLSALALRRRPAWRAFAALLSSLSANFAGVPLAGALILLLGAQGWLPGLLHALGLTMASGLDLYGLSGLLLAYLLFQLPLALMMMAGPLVQLDGALEEAAWTLGAGPGRFWWRVGLPVLAPSLIETASLLFANAAAAYATPFALGGTAAHVLAVRIAAAVSGDIFEDPSLAQQLSLMLLGLMVLVLLGGRWLARRCQRRLGAGGDA